MDGDGDTLSGVRGEALDLERGALGPGVRRELGEEPLDGRDHEHVEEPDVRALMASAVDAERHAVELPGDFSARRTAPTRWWLAKRFAAVWTMWVARRSAKSPCFADSWRMGDGVQKIDPVELVEVAGGSVEVVVDASFVRRMMWSSLV